MPEEEDSANEMGRSGEGEASLYPTEIEPIVSSAPNVVAFFVRFKHFSDTGQNTVRSKSYDDSRGRIWGLTVGFGAEGSPADELCCSVYCISERRTTITAAVTCLANSQSTYGSRRLTLTKDEVLFGRSPSPEYGQRTGRLRISRSTVLSEFCSNDVLTLKVVIEVDELRHLVPVTSDSVEDDEPPAKERLQELRYDPTTADLTIQVLNPGATAVEECLELFDTIPVHREVLCAASDVFQAMFSVDTVGSNTITISDYPIYVVKAMVSFMYDEKCDPAVLETVGEALLSIASVYGVTSLTAYVERFFLSRLNFDNISFILHLCQTYEECHELQHRLLEFVSDHRESVLRSETFRKSLSTDMLQKIVNTLCNITETEIKDTASGALDEGSEVEVCQQERYQDRDSRAEGDVSEVGNTDRNVSAAAASSANASVCFLPAPTQPLVSTGYVFTSIEALKQAVDLWCDPIIVARAHKWYGHIFTWNTSRITSMKELFKDKDDFNDDISSWDVSNVRSMEGMFSWTERFNQPIGTWDVSKVKNMEFMFRHAKQFNQHLGAWNVSKVAAVGGMFKEAEAFNQPIDTWDVSSVTRMANMFYYADAFNQPIDTWDVSNVTSFGNMFHSALSFNQPIGTWDVSTVTSMESMFCNAEAFNQPMDTWDVSNVTSMNSMFYGAWSFNQRIDTWDVSKVTNMNRMFCDGKAFNQPIGTWDVSSVTIMEFMFCNAKAFNQPVGTWDVSGVISMNCMFCCALDFNQPIGVWDVSSVTNMQGMFYMANAFNQPIGSWDVSKVTNMNSLFYSANALNQPMGSWDTSKITRMDDMFFGVQALTGL